MIYPVKDIKYHNNTLSLLEHIQNIIDSYFIPVSVRQIHYRLVAKKIIQNTLSKYKAISRIITNGRYTGHLDWDRIIDDTRGAYKTTSWNSIDSAMKYAINRFRFDRWADSEYYIEVWAEKRTMTNLFYSVTDGYDVYLNIGGGFNSTSALWEAVKRFREKDDKEIIILYFGDFDPSGYFMADDIENRLSELMGRNIHVNRVALNLEHIQKYNLEKAFKVMARKQNGEIYDKLKADTRAQSFIKQHGELFQVEIEALDPNILLQFVENSILQFLDLYKYNNFIELEKTERKRIKDILKYQNKK